MNPTARFGTRVALRKTSSRAPRLRVVGRALGLALSGGVETCVLMKICVMSSFRNMCDWVLRPVKSTGCETLRQ